MLPQISPIALEAGAVVVGLFLLMFEAFANERDKTKVAWLGVTGLVALLALSFFPQTQSVGNWTNFYRADALAMFFKRFAIVTTIVVLIMSVEYRGVVTKFIFGENEAGLGEFFALPVLTCAGLMWAASAVDFTLIFVSVELITISFYVLVAYMRRNVLSLEAGVKYLIIGALSTGFFVYGITWIYGVTGETNLNRIALAMASSHAPAAPLLFGFMLVLVALGFKIAAAPFQIWVPDVYQGAPTPITAYLSVGSKAAGFVVLVRLVNTFLAVPALREKVIGAMFALAALTLIYGNLAALPQTNLKRLLAYSSIAHAGYLLVAVASFGAPSAPGAITFYLAAYLLMTLLTFLVMTIVSNRTGGDDIAHFAGLARRSPWLAFAMLVAMASLAGIPFTAGFFGKFFVFVAAYQQHQFTLIALGVITVAAGFYYYLKVVRAMYWQPASDETLIEGSPAANALIAVMIALIFLLGVYPKPLFDLFGKPTAAEKVAAR